MQLQTLSATLTAEERKETKMGIVLGLFIIILGCFLIHLWVDNQGGDSVGWLLASVTAGLLLCIALVDIPFNRMDIRAKMAGFDSVRVTVEKARIDGNLGPYELAAIQRSVVEQNEWLARTQYWAGHWMTSWFVPTKILLVDPIK